MGSGGENGQSWFLLLAREEHKPHTLRRFLSLSLFLSLGNKVAEALINETLGVWEQSHMFTSIHCLTMSPTI